MEIDGIPKLSPDQPELYCEKCNITFKKLEVFKVHKENYCESRHANVEAIQAARAEKQREREEMKLVNKVVELNSQSLKKFFNIIKPFRSEQKCDHWKTTTTLSANTVKSRTRVTTVKLASSPKNTMRLTNETIVRPEIPIHLILLLQITGTTIY